MNTLTLSRWNYSITTINNPIDNRYDIIFTNHDINDSDSHQLTYEEAKTLMNNAKMIYDGLRMVLMDTGGIK